MADTTPDQNHWEPLRAAMSDIAERLLWAEVPHSSLVLLDPETALDEDTVRRFIAQRRDASWLPDLPTELAVPLDVAEHWAPTVYQLIWSAPSQASSHRELDPWLRGALAAYLTHRRFPQLCVPAPQTGSWRSLDQFAYQQSGALIARIYGERAVVQLLAGTTRPHEVFGAEVAQVVSSAIAEEGLTPGRGSDDPSRFCNAVVEAFLAGGQSLPPARSFEHRMAWEAVAFSCVRPVESGIANALAFASCHFDFSRRSMSAHGFESGTEKNSILPPTMCQQMVDAGRSNHAMSLAPISPRAIDLLVQTVFGA